MSILRFVLVFALLSMGASVLADPPAADALPSRSAPAGMQSVDELAGGRVVSGALKDVSSGEAAYKAGLRQIKGYFDAPPTLLSAIRSKDGTVTLSVFSAALRHAPVNGMVVATYNSAGASRFSMLFDSPNQFATSLSPMLARMRAMEEEALERERPAEGKPGLDLARYEAAASHVTLNHTEFPDGTATIGLAPGFTASEMSGGMFFASNAAGSYIRMFSPMRMLDPNGSVYQTMKRLSDMTGGGLPHIPGQIVIPYTTDPVSAWKQFLAENARQNHSPNPNPQVTVKPLTGIGGGWTGKLMSGTMTLQGREFVFTGSVLGSPPPDAQGTWMIQTTVLAAPAARAAQDLPAMIAMQHSEQVDVGKVQQQTMRNIAQINEDTTRWLRENNAAATNARNERFLRAMAQAAAAREVMDTSTVNFIHYINKDAKVQRDSSGAAQTLASILARSLQTSNPGQFNPIPLGQ